MLYAMSRYTFKIKRVDEQYALMAFGILFCSLVKFRKWSQFGLNVITHVMYTTSFTSFMYVHPLAFHTSKTNYTLILGRERDKSYVWPTQQSQPRANLGFLAIYATATAPEGRFTGSHGAKLRMAAAFDALAVRTGWLFRNSRLKIRSCSFALCKFPPSLLDFAPRLVVREACHLFLYFLTYFAIYYHCYQELVKLERL